MVLVTVLGAYLLIACLVIAIVVAYCEATDGDQCDYCLEHCDEEHLEKVNDEIICSLCLLERVANGD